MSDLNLTGFHLTFDDEFNGSALDASKWKMGDKWNNRYLSGNGEKEYYAGFPGDSYNPVSVGNGVVDIRAQPASWSGMDTHGQPYTSGEISTADKYTQTYGYFEMRAQLPDGQGMWPAFWTIPADGSWPPEIDVVEKVSNDHSVYQTTHWDGGQDGSKYEGINPADGMHTYGVDWEADKITYFVDGVKTAEKANVANAPEYMLVNMSVGGYWPGDPGGEAGDMKVDYVRAYSKDSHVQVVAGDGAGMAGSDPNPGQPANPGNPPPPVTHPDPGTGKDTITVHVSEDAFQGDAVFKLMVDGKQVGGDTAVTASHGAGAWQDITFHTDLAAAAKNVSVVFTNDGWGGDAAHDRNMYVQSIAIDGKAQTPDHTTLGQTGDTATVAVPAPGGSTGADIGTGKNAIKLHVSEDAYQGDAKFHLVVDGTQVGSDIAVTANHGAGAWQDFTIHTDLAATAKAVGIVFTNDSWGGDAAHDRNMYVDSIAVDGKAQTPDHTALGRTGDTATVQIPAQSPAQDTITLHVSEDAFQGNAAFKLLVDGQQVGGDTPVTASHGAGAWQDITFHTSLALATKAMSVQFTSDAWGGDAAHDRNLYVQSATIDGHTLTPDHTALMRTGDTATFDIAHHPEIFAHTA